MTLISDANFRGRSLFLLGSHVTAAFRAHNSTSREGHGGKAQFKSEIIIQTALWGSLMTKVSLRCSYNSALEYQLGLSGTMESERSDWHSKRLSLVGGHLEHTLCTVTSARRHRTEKGRGKTKLRWVRWCGWRKAMQGGEFHCHVSPKERGACKFCRTAYSISSRNPQLVPRESSP